MIQIKKYVIEGIIAHAKESFPIEACGYLAGKDGIILEQFRLTNVDQSSEHFSFDPREQFEVLKKVRSIGMEIIANYHSHPATPARPSQEDIRLANDPDIYYCIVSLSGDYPEIKLYRIQDRVVSEHELFIIN